MEEKLFLVRCSHRTKGVVHGRREFIILLPLSLALLGIIVEVRPELLTDIIGFSMYILTL